ncbi:hypothetical protein C9374_011692 [Naegleria lovaniensis]|uniref:Uncharacterized protein n=1 Tax=Naegleria lovaniensis TaxID=51637 RepID=A0AA88KID7_NAELO|nr:uncharacterized protein C9374_011692 [Naegleria lovaniensis]KAG2373807.1 hypothetical protein C9374_011692 [Naegleria lovaniensis]
MPNRVRKSYSVEYVNNTIDSLAYDNNQQICFMVMGDYVIQELQVPSWVDISYPQVVDYSLNQTLSHTLTVYYYDWYAEVINKPHRYFFDHVLSSQQVSLPNESDALLYRFNMVGASGQHPSAPSYPGTGLVNFEFSFNASAGFLDVNGQPVDIDVETLSCAYEKKNSNSLSLKDGTSQVDLQKQVLQCRWYGASDMDLVSIGLVASRKTLPPKPTPSTSPTPTNKDTETIIIAVSASVGGTVLLLVIGCVALSMAYYLFIKKRKAKYQNL